MLPWARDLVSDCLMPCNEQAHPCMKNIPAASATVASAAPPPFPSLRHLRREPGPSAPPSRFFRGGMLKRACRTGAAAGIMSIPRLVERDGHKWQHPTHHTPLVLRNNATRATKLRCLRRGRDRCCAAKDRLRMACCKRCVGACGHTARVRILAPPPPGEMSNKGKQLMADSELHSLPQRHASRTSTHVTWRSRT